VVLLLLLYCVVVAVELWCYCCCWVAVSYLLLLLLPSSYTKQQTTTQQPDPLILSFLPVFFVFDQKYIRLLSKQFPGSVRVRRLRGIRKEANDEFVSATRLYDSILEDNKTDHVSSSMTYEHVERNSSFPFLFLFSCCLFCLFVW